MICIQCDGKGVLEEKCPVCGQKRLCDKCAGKGWIKYD